MKIAIVTGAAGGIGFATVEELINKGFCVVGMNRRPYENVKELFERWTALSEEQKNALWQIIRTYDK